MALFKHKKQDLENAAPPVGPDAELGSGLELGLEAGSDLGLTPSDAPLLAVLEMLPIERITDEDVRRAEETLQKYKSGKANLDARIVENERWYKLRHWEYIRGENANASDPEPASAWLFNSIANKHADAMDNFPEPNVLPREAGDKKDAEMLSAILPAILEENEYEQTYSDMWWYKLKSGTGVQGVFWDTRKNNGLGDIDVRRMDLLNLFWEPGIKDIQKSRNLFHVELMDNDLLKESYPAVADRLGGGNNLEANKYIYDDTIDTSEKTVVVDWYYKGTSSGRDILHYCKFAAGKVLYASENDPIYAEKGFYDHGKYPFVFDPMFVVEDSPAGFGYVDIMKDPQLYIDKLNQVILKNAIMSSRKRYFINSSGEVNEAEFADWKKDFVHVGSSKLGEDSIREIVTSPLGGIYFNVLTQKIDEIKETSGNRDFSQGGTSGGVTAASAIAALQEAGSKLSRDMIKSSYRAFTRVNYLVLELIRQFYTEPRFFRILGEQGQAEFASYDNRSIQPQAQGSDFGVEMGVRVPIFDIKITSQRSSPFSKISQNELAKEFFGMGFFNPQMADQALSCMEMMDFEGKPMVLQRISEGATMAQQLQEMQQQMAKMAAIIDAQNGTSISGGASGQAGGMAGQMGGGSGQAPSSGGTGRPVETNALGAAMKGAMNAKAGAATSRASRMAMPK